MLWLCEGVAFCEGELVTCEAMELRLLAADGALLCSPFVSGMMAQAYQSFQTGSLSPVFSDFQQFIEWGRSDSHREKLGSGQRSLARNVAVHGWLGAS